MKLIRFTKLLIYNPKSSFYCVFRINPKELLQSQFLCVNINQKENYIESI